MDVITTKADHQGGTSLFTVHAKQEVELVYVTPVGGLSLGETFLSSGFSADWVPTLIKALRMAHDIAEGSPHLPHVGHFKEHTNNGSS